jgi:hypothetical protein
MSVKVVDIQKIQKAVEVLKLVQKYIDPNAFIAGGYAAQLYFGKSWGSDIDIFFSSPNYEIDALGYNAINQLKLLFKEEIQPVNLNTYWYNKRFCRIASMRGPVDFIQIKDAPKLNERSKYIFEKFDVNMCKIRAGIYGHCLTLKPSKEFLYGLEKKKLIYQLDLTDHNYENIQQNEITKNRLEKYKRRFPNYKVKKI